MIKIKNFKKCIALIGITISICSNIVLFITFLSAYMNNGVITITINTCNEANTELILIPIVLILGLYSFIYVFRGE